jgi:hypothetical protein
MPSIVYNFNRIRMRITYNIDTREPYINNLQRYILQVSSVYYNMQLGGAFIYVVRVGAGVSGAAKF